ncbi:MAG: valine--tRNA ligase [Pelagibacterales bacterium]|nr:valine--tRNA ligase [Pelagibacterales bacterium]OUU61959.1 MAG: valine--tRNA ligase [Alphaproteobacteria bacterium TMED62]|tara:strand:- start:20245 stop:22899 length:2655 start_codon:yes stop_codon:yes gene_type:complete
MSLKLIDKDVDHLNLEKKIYNTWLDEDLFCSNPSNEKDKFSIMMPPPNVTGTLHIGHALNMTIQDILARYWRMNNKDVLWQPGTDHAGIATQKIVETNLKNETNLNKIDIGKEEFIKQIWIWKKKSGDKITNQIKRLGASPDWSRQRFTLDEEMTKAVTYTFVELFKKGLIYRDKRLVNWDIGLQTAVSDLEVEQIEKEGDFFYIKYYLEDSLEYLEVATTRPETLFGDQCLAVNPKDSRYKKFIGKRVYLPLTNETIPIISDDFVDIEKGSGVLKITPAHDFNDYKIGKKNNLNLKIVFDKLGKFNANVPSKYQGMDRIESRSIIISDLKKNGNFLKIEKIKHTVPYGDRSSSIIEPYLTDQWFMSVHTIAKEVIQFVKKNETKFYPASWSKIFFLWLENIEPWCISRQIWWGHRMPIWYGPDGKVFCAHTEKEAKELAKKFYKETKILTQETDVLDTWFSSALWPMSTLGWPNDKDIFFKKYFPTSVLVTGFDIIFFWVARMMIQSVNFTNKTPFKDVYIHALVRDKDGNKMSKSKGNVIDPIDIINKFGADSLRYTLSLMAAQGRDIKLSEENVKVNRNFITKIRNAYNFLCKNQCFDSKAVINYELKKNENIWILKALNDHILSISDNIENYKFNEATKDIYKFTKNIFCDWYLEFIKISLNNETDLSIKQEIKACASKVFQYILKLAHPFIPFITDDIYVNYLKNKKFLIQDEWPSTISFKFLIESNNEIENIIKIITICRNIKASLKIEPKKILEVFYTSDDLTIENNNFLINKLGRINIKKVKNSALRFENLLKFVNNNIVFYVNKMQIDNESLVSKNTSILKEQLLNLEKDIAILKSKVENDDFLKKAPKLVIDKFVKKMKYKLSLKNKILSQIKS